MMYTIGVLITVFAICNGQPFPGSTSRDPYWDTGRTGGFGRAPAPRGPDFMSPSSSYPGTQSDFYPSSSSSAFRDPYDPLAYPETGGRFSSGLSGFGAGSEFGAGGFGAGTGFETGAFGGAGGAGGEQPPPEEYLGARGGQNGYPVHGGYCAGERCADGGLRAGVGLGIGSGTAQAMEHRRRTGVNENVRMYEMFASGPQVPGAAPHAGMGFGGMPARGPPAPPAYRGMPGMPGAAMPGMPPMMPPRGGFMGGPPMGMGGPPMGMGRPPMYRFR